MTTTTEPQWAETDEAPEVLAVSEFNTSVGFFGYDAELTTDRHGSPEIVVRYDGETLAAFPKSNGDWLEDLASYGYRLENGAMAA